MNVTKARTYYGFFGCLDNATVENLTLKGQVYCAEPYARVGGLAGYAIGDVTIRNCGSAVNVSALARGCEGVGGLVGGYEDGIEYKWEDHKMVIENAITRRNVVCTGTDANATIGGLVGGNKNCVQLENCYNAGTVYGPGVQAAGLLGNAGGQTGDNCKPSMKTSSNAGKVVGAEGKAFVASRQPNDLVCKSAGLLCRGRDARQTRSRGQRWYRMIRGRICLRSSAMDGRSILENNGKAVSRAGPRPVATDPRW